ncbi:cupin domain-containing protein [Candidatus Micrarchaeota archaeon]|nr:cupin domain-containing protein [Candidatus Micrarchaeota archaeon]
MRLLNRVKHTNESGWLAELVSMNYDDEPFNCLHSYVVMINPGCTRANHYHKEKEEWIGICSGELTLLFENMENGVKDKIILNADEKEYKLVYIPPMVAHTIINKRNEKATVIVFSTTFSKEKDVYLYEVKEND